MDRSMAIFICDKRGPGVIVSGVWPPIPVDKWRLTMDRRKVEDFRKEWTKDMKATPWELDGSVGSPDQRNHDATTGLVGEGRASPPFLK